MCIKYLQFYLLLILTVHLMNLNNIQNKKSKFSTATQKVVSFCTYLGTLFILDLAVYFNPKISIYIVFSYGNFYGSMTCQNLWTIVFFSWITFHYRL